MLPDELREPKFDEMRGFLPHLSVAVANAEIVSEVAPIQVGAENEAVLVDFVRIVRNEPNSSSEGVLRNHVPLNQLRFDMLALRLQA